ncbi:hypothetical protein [Candidatus Mycolicibacterium alkanivorans]|uniref:Uncharacterized protein n=1 Tax=Candidatus Mycolicibacterium alkanivorans TaxID=2954114 RepID=A0ABS9YV68_9MYCO|nr:hypothetical protein [Candidatus Mycolicibacterium alkanivorans]MCI4675132.1 hypothetical protein [Candidatus Mycolicibacterium alkanivorans]
MGSFMSAAPTTAKALGVDDIVDVVVPGAVMPEFLRRARDLAVVEGATMSGCGHGRNPQPRGGVRVTV